MSSTEPYLKQFELELSPVQFRLALLSRDSMLVGYRDSATGKPSTVVARYRGHEQQIDGLLESVHWLLVANDVLDTPETAPKSAFSSKYLKGEAVHLVVAYSNGRTWRSVYEMHAVPDNIRSLVDQAKYLAIQSVEKPPDQADPSA